MVAVAGCGMTLAEHVAASVVAVNTLYAAKRRSCTMRDRHRAASAAAAEAIAANSPIAMSAALKRLLTLAEALRKDRYVFRGKSR